MRYPVLNASDATLFLKSRGAESPVGVQQVVRSRGNGPDLDEWFVADLRAELAVIRKRFPLELKKGSRHGAEFESAASEIVHRRIPPVPEVQADPDFWTWLAVVHFADLIEWRYGSGEAPADLPNYGIGSRSENLLYRLWLRGDLGLDETSSDKYHLSRRGDVDFWRSHVFRQSYANAKIFARALVKFQFPDEHPDEPRLKISEIRELVKRLRRARTNLLVEMLDEDSALTLIRDELGALSSEEVTAST
jgi:hypothetical protein